MVVVGAPARVIVADVGRHSAEKRVYVSPQGRERMEPGFLADHGLHPGRVRGRRGSTSHVGGAV